MSSIENYVNLPSLSDYRELLDKYHAFAVAQPLIKAIREHTFVDKNYGTGYYFTRNADEKPDKIAVIFPDGHVSSQSGKFTILGLRVTLQLAYNKNYTMLKNCRMVTNTAYVWNGKINKAVKSTRTAPIVTFGKIDYVWLNKEECEKGIQNTMRLISVTLLANAKPFDENGETNDYGSNATIEIRRQCEKEALRYATTEEKSMLVKVRLSSEDGYEKAEPILQIPVKKTDEDKNYDDWNGLYSDLE